MALHLHRSDRPTTLADGLAELLADDPLDVFDRELVIAPSPGVERWLAQRLSHRLGAATGDDGVCAGLDVRTPWSFMSMLLGREFDDPWHPDRLAWPVLEAIDACIGRPGFETLAHHLGADPVAPGEDAWWHRARQSRRYAVARRLAGLYASYAEERPELLRAWERGEDSPGPGAHDLVWQAPLWRATLDAASESVDAADGVAFESPVARLDRVAAQLRDGTLDRPLPPRISFFGYTRVPMALLTVLDAVAARHDVHLWLPHPSDALWQALSRGAREQDRSRAADPSGEVASHPLLATSGRDIRELQTVLTAHHALDEPVFPAEQAGRPATRLGRLQADISANRPPSAATEITDTTSVQVHACHGPARQVEALRETLLWLLDENAGRLQPRDIVVMCPDVETFAPLIKAAFAATEDDTLHPGRRLRVQLADRGVAATNPLAEVALRLITLVTGRVTATEVLDFADLPAVRERFGFTGESLERITRWVKETAARWGLDGTHRGEYGLPSVVANTWATALDRLALGVTMSADTDSAAAGWQPVDDLGSSDISTASAFITLLDEVTRAAHEIRGHSTVDPHLPRASFTTREWFSWLRRHVEALAASAPDAAWHLGQFERELAFLETGSHDGTPLRVTDVRIMLEQRWASRPTRSNFRNGAISVCTLTPMRSVPHKAVVLLGLDDDAFPRSHVVDGDDVLARHPLVGERDPRSEDRQLLLDALMAAEEYFIAFYSGFDERDGTRRPPAVPLQEIVAAAAATGVEPDPGPREGEPPSFVREHPLQAFDERNFLPLSDPTEHPVNPLPGGSFDGAAMGGALALRRFHTDPRPRTPLVPTPLDPVEPGDVALADLARFFENPAREFLKERLQVGVTYERDEIPDDLPIDLDSLEKWAVGDRLINRTLDGVPLDRAVADVSRGGLLPPPPLTSPLADIRQTVERIVTALPEGERRSYDISVTVPLPQQPNHPSAQVRVTGVVPHVIDDEIQVVTYSSVSAKPVAQAWVHLLALCVAYPDRPWTAAIRGKNRSVRLTTPDEAARHLAGLVLERNHGLRSPLPYPVKTAMAWNTTFRQRTARGALPDRAARSADQVAKREWEGSKFAGENADPWWQRVFETDAASYADLVAQPLFRGRSGLLWVPLLESYKENQR